jgi:hypothetical protein
VKVGYRLLTGGISTAYLGHAVDEDDEDDEDDDTYSGFDKYTEEPVMVRWTGDTWVQVQS